jgi:hypothetical protein
MVCLPALDEEIAAELGYTREGNAAVDDWPP